jgi:enoyl-CoA hydratase/carnithine racemase
MILCGERLDAETALRIGLVEQVVDSGESRGHALLLAAKVARQSPVAVRTITPRIQGARERSPNTWLAEERERFVDLFDADDTREGVNAFLEKREPQWRNK